MILKLRNSGKFKKGAMLVGKGAGLAFLKAINTINIFR